MKEIQLVQGTIRYRDEGSGDPIVFVHGLLVNGELWRDVAPRLAADFRVITPDWPLGSQELALREDADVTPPGIAKLIADFLDALELENVTIVGNDTGGALCQIVATRYPERIGRLVLTPCDAYEHFPPPAFKPLVALGRIPGAVSVVLATMGPAWARRLPIAFGWLMKRPDDALTASWIDSPRRNPLVRRQASTTMVNFSKSHTLAAAARFKDFHKPVLIAWAREDKFFKVSDAERLAADFPNARLELIDDSYSFVSLDQPRRTAELIGAFAREPAPGAANGVRA
jgi:pimeloyl-ACP methyl ester carboxylesterase